MALRLHHDVNTTLKVRVESTTPAPVPAVAPTTGEGKREDVRTEKRGRRPEAPAAKEEKAAPAGSKTKAPKAEKPAKSGKN